MLHGLLSDKDHNFAPELARRVAAHLALNVVRFDFRSAADPRAEPEYRYRFCGFEEDVDDVRVVAEQVWGGGLSLGPVRAVLGHSRGANVAIMAVATWHEACGPTPLCIAIAPRFDMPGMLAKFDPSAVAALLAPGRPLDAAFEWETKRGPVAVTRADVEYVQGLRMEPFLAQLPQGHPLLLLHGTADVTIPHADSVSMSGAREGGGTEFHSVEGAAHTFGRTRHTEAVVALVCSFLSRHCPDAGILCGTVRSVMAAEVRGVLHCAAVPTPPPASSSSSPRGTAERDGKARAGAPPQPQLAPSGQAAGRGRLCDKVVLITGGAAGIGRATAQLCAAEGARVVVTGRDSLGNSEEECRAIPATFVKVDHATLEGCTASVEATLQAHGRIDVLFNNAGVVMQGTAEGTSEEAWRETMDLNVTSVWRMCKLVLPHMRAQSTGGVIVNNASDWGLVGAEGAVAYCASKGAVVQLTRCLALDHARDGVRVNAICPGDTYVERWTREGYFKGSGAVPRSEANGPRPDLPLGRVAGADEIAKGVLFLATSDSSYMTGQTLTIDGGNTAR